MNGRDGGAMPVVPDEAPSRRPSDQRDRRHRSSGCGVWGMRRLVWLLAVLAAACGHGRRATPPPAQPDDAPGRFVVDSGALVRAQLRTGAVVTGRLLETLVRGSPHLVLCGAAPTAPCDPATGAGVRRLATADLAQLAVRGRMTHIGLYGFYLGVIGGVLADRRDTGLIPVPTGVAAGALAAAVGSRIGGWVPLMACRVHGPCGWRVDRRAAPADR
jgi:hypothetical protein